MLTRLGRRSTTLSPVSGGDSFPALADRRALPSLAWRSALAVPFRVAHIVGGLELSGSEVEKARGVNLVCRDPRPGDTQERTFGRLL